MNGTEQRKHTTAVATVEANMVEALEKIIQEIEEQDAIIVALRAALDRHVVALRNADDSEHAFAESIWLAHDALRMRGFWARLNWLLTGR